MPSGEPGLFVCGRGSGFGFLTEDVFDVGAEDFGNAPGLCEATTRCKRWVAVKDLAQGAQAMRVDMLE